MIWISIIAPIFSAVGIGISIWAANEAKKSNKAVMRQNLETELAGLEGKSGAIEAQIEKAIAEGEEKKSRSYGFQPNPNQLQIDALESEKKLLIKRKAEIERQLTVA